LSVTESILQKALAVWKINILKLFLK
jgi:hypothetical protein